MHKTGKRGQTGALDPKPVKYQQTVPPKSESNVPRSELLHADLMRPEMWPKLIANRLLKLYQWFRYQSIPYRQLILQ